MSGDNPSTSLRPDRDRALEDAVRHQALSSLSHQVEVGRAEAAKISRGELYFAVAFVGLAVGTGWKLASSDKKKRTSRRRRR